MRILALQLKRIGDLILTMPALTAARQAFPAAEITIGADAICEKLFPALTIVDDALVLRGKTRNRPGWAKLLRQKFDVCLDFTGNDRSAFCTLLSKAPKRLTFASSRKSPVRAMAYTTLVDSSVRDHHTIDHYCHLLRGLGIDSCGPLVLRLPDAARAKASTLCRAPYVVVHAGSARQEKLWMPDRWAAVVAHIREKHGLECVLTGGNDPHEREHLGQIERAAPRGMTNLAGKLSLLEFAALIGGARACLSCDTAAVHLAAAFEIPQIVLYGMTNPFHWRPRHAQALILSAAQPDAPLTEFTPRMKGASMGTISTQAVIRATDVLLGNSKQ
jgi:ADP-heptose:LPS heptosyltransferase